MDAVAPMNVIVDELIEANELFMEVAAGAGAAPLLVLAGTVLVAFAVAVFGYLTLGAGANLVRPS